MYNKFRDLIISHKLMPTIFKEITINNYANCYEIPKKTIFF